MLIAMPVREHSVRVEAPARLHLGLLDLGSHSGRSFGSIGLAIDHFPTIVTARPGSGVKIDGAAGVALEPQVRAVLEHYQLPPRIAIEVEYMPPSHAGLGSGTQLAIATGAAVLSAFQRTVDVREIAQLTARGKRSGAGIALFEAGGLVVDGGHGAQTRVPPVLSRLEFPSPWRIIVIVERGAEGLSGRAERDAFRTLAPMDRAVAAELSHLTLLGILPAVAEADFVRFSRSIAAVQGLMGDYFTPLQSAGRFASARVAAAIDYCIAACGLVGVGQSSWGPTGFAFAEDSRAADRVVEMLRDHFAGQTGLEFLHCGGRNHGALLSDTAAAALAQAGAGDRPVPA